jgi:hypothetical protein
VSPAVLPRDGTTAMLSEHRPEQLTRDNACPYTPRTKEDIR